MIDGIPATLERIEREKLADRVTVYRRGAEIVYFNEFLGGRWAVEPRACAALEAERNRPMTLQERREYAKGLDRLAEQLARTERRASAEEIRRIENLRRQAKAEFDFI